MSAALLFDILTRIKAAIVARALPGIGAANVILQEVPGPRAAELPAQQFPCVVIAPSGAEQIDPQGGTTSRDDVVYRVVVALVAIECGDSAARFAQALGWRQSVRRLFHDQPLDELCFTVRVQPLDIVERDAWLQNRLLV